MTMITIIGSQHTPIREIKKFIPLVEAMTRRGVVFRSGGARGFDQVLRDVSPTKREIYLPHVRFGGPLEDRTNVYIPKFEFDNYVQAESIVRKFWVNEQLTSAKLRYLTHNIYQVLGKDLNTPSDVVYYWSNFPPSNEQMVNDRDVAMVLKVATYYKIPIVNLKTHGDTVLESYLNSDIDVTKPSGEQ